MTLTERLERAAAIARQAGKPHFAQEAERMLKTLNDADKETGQWASIYRALMRPGAIQVCGWIESHAREWDRQSKDWSVAHYEALAREARA